MRDVLADAGLRAFVKTSGNRGLHLYAPIRPDWEFLDVGSGDRGGAERAAGTGGGHHASWKELRGERIFLDYNQAARDRTIAGAYSPRPLPTATVHTRDVGRARDGRGSSRFTVRTVPDRLASIGDPWATMHDAAGGLETLLGWWERDLAAGEGELPFPPDYPKMPGEPPRVQPSRAKKPD